eukprot:m.327861 g.327861  ORF g.327861 m.327861 type:complete len:413 (-) comp16026_c4_seq1:60-1298(-)
MHVAYGNGSMASKDYSALPGGMSVTDDAWELIDPNPDIHELFQIYNTLFFDGKLACAEVKWSPRMTRCAGICSFDSQLCSIRLSVPLLRLRPRSDLINTLLHEMIHGFLFLTQRIQDRDGHGPSFQFHMHRLNKMCGSNITVYHTFHDEVKMYQTHWWRCNGSCVSKPPFFGMVKRAMNRAPGPSDFWFARHQQECGGTFIKIREPEDYGKKGKRGSGDPGESKRKTPALAAGQLTLDAMVGKLKANGSNTIEGPEKRQSTFSDARKEKQRQSQSESSPCVHGSFALVAVRSDEDSDVVPLDAMPDKSLERTSSGSRGIAVGRGASELNGYLRLLDHRLIVQDPSDKGPCVGKPCVASPVTLAGNGVDSRPYSTPKKQPKIETTKLHNNAEIGPAVVLLDDDDDDVIVLDDE